MSRLRDLPGLAAAVAGPLVLYTLTLPRTVVLEDDGFFLMAGAHLGIAHPPGYPLFTLICHLFMQLPFGTPAFLGHLSSAFLGALACGAVYVCARLLGASWIPALAAAWLFGASEHVWSQAIIAEVYTLNALLFFAVYALLLQAPARERAGGKPAQANWFWAAAVYGLSLANHWPLMGLATPGLALAALPSWRAILRGWPAILAGFSLSAAFPYAWMVWRSWQEPATSFLGPIDSWKTFVDYITRQGYAGIGDGPSAGWMDRLELLQWFGNQVAWQLTFVGFVLALLGLTMLLRERRFCEAGSGVLVFLGQSVALMILLNFDFDYYFVAVFRPYSLVCYGLLAIWLATGLQFVTDRLATKRFRAAWLPAAAAALAGLGMTAWSVQSHWEINNRAGSDVAARHANLLFDLLPEKATLLVSGDLETPTLGYYRFVEERRPDITLINTNGLIYGNRPFPSGSTEAERKAVLRAFVDDPGRQVFLLSGSPPCERCTTRWYGPFREAIQGASETIEVRTVPEVEQYFKEAVERRILDAWEYLYLSRFLWDYGNYLGFMVVSKHPDLMAVVDRMQPYAERNHHSLTGMIEILLKYWNPGHAQRTAALLDKAERLLAGARLTTFQKGRLYYLKGRLKSLQGDEQAAVKSYRRSRDLYPNPERNDALRALERLQRVQ